MTAAIGSITENLEARRKQLSAVNAQIERAQEDRIALEQVITLKRAEHTQLLASMDGDRHAAEAELNTWRDAIQVSCFRFLRFVGY